jgi:hypothetical protein
MGMMKHKLKEVFGWLHRKGDGWRSAHLTSINENDSRLSELARLSLAQLFSIACN